MHLGHLLLFWYRPKMLLVSNFAGAAINHDVVKTAYLSGIKTVSLISEGNIKPAMLEEFLWGWNKDKKLYLDKFLLWSKRSRGFILEKYPDLKEVTCVTGATGFDQYKLFRQRKKSEFIKKYNIKYKKIVGLAGWGFCHFYNEYFEQREEQLLETIGAKQIEMHQSDLSKMQDIYRDIVEQNPDTLFIVRYHPGTLDYEKSEFFKLSGLKNIFISDKNNNTDETISDLINVSDLWIGYDTTTAMEAWLLGKTTFLINPTSSDFVRDRVHQGSPIVKGSAEADKLIKEYFSTGKIVQFEVLQEQRQKIIEDSIGFSDGKSYVRAADEIIKVFRGPERTRVYHSGFRLKALRQLAGLFLAKVGFTNKRNKFLVIFDFAKDVRGKYSEAIGANEKKR